MSDQLTLDALANHQLRPVHLTKKPATQVTRTDHTMKYDGSTKLHVDVEKGALKDESSGATEL